MTSIDLIKKNFYTTNYLTICQMYLKSYKKYNEITEEDLKKYNPGHLGSSLGINFLLSNINYYLNKNNLKGKTVIGTGHSGVSLTSNLWLNGTLNKNYKKYSTNITGLNNLIEDFGKNIRSEINPEYPGVIYDGGELGYSLAVSYGYSIDSEADLVPCIIGDGEAETGTLSASWFLNRLLKTKSKVLPIINLNNYKMGSNSYLSRLNDDDLKKYFSALGYNTIIIDVKKYKNVECVIEAMQNALETITKINNPLIIFKSPKGWTLPDVNEIMIENSVSSHKNPLIDFDDKTKLEIVKKYLNKYYYNIFENGILDKNFKNSFSIDEVRDSKEDSVLPNIYNIDINTNTNIQSIEEYLSYYLKDNNYILFSPDEIYSNKLGKISNNCFEILNENVLQAVMQGYIQSGKNSIFIGYEGFMPLVNSMVSQYYKFLLQKKNSGISEKKNSLNYILTSTCWENTYSHQNPSFVNDLLIKDDEFYNVLYPKNGKSFMYCLEECLKDNDSINVITISKRTKNNSYKKDDNTKIEIILDNANPDIILCATGDYMLDHINKLANILINNNIKVKIVYVTNPKVLDINSKYTLTNDEFFIYFNKNKPVIYLFNGYASIIKSMLYERNVKFKVMGYNDKVSTFGGINDNLNNNGLSLDYLSSLCYDEINNKGKILKLRR